MSTSKHIDRICVVVLLITLLVTGLFMNGKALGITSTADADAGNSQFTANDLNADWDSSNATQIVLTGDNGSVKGDGAYLYNGDVYIVYAGKYVISGELYDGSVIVDADGNDKIWILLNGVSLHCDDSAAIEVKQADKVFLTLANGTENKLSGGAEYTDEAVSNGIDGVIYSKDDLTINGSGSLCVNAAYKHGIVGNDDLVIVGGNIEITAAQDGIHANDSARFADVNITINAGDDGITVSNDDETAYIYIESGNINIPSCYEGIEAIDITIAGGVIDIRSSDDGINANGRGSNSVIRITGGDISIINENGRDADGLDSNGSIYISGGNIFISVNGNGGSSALDCGSENGGVCEISGGTVIAAGGSAMAEGFDSSSEQNFIMYTTSTSAAGTTLTLENEAGNTLISETIPCAFSSVVISTPELQLGETCTISVGDNSEAITVDNSSASGGFGKGGMFGGRGNRFDQSADDRSNTGDTGNANNQQQDVPEMPDGDFGRNQMPQMPNGSFPDSKEPDGKNTGNGGDIPQRNFRPEDIHGNGQDNGSLPEISDGEGIADMKPGFGGQEDFFNGTQVPNQDRNKNGMGGRDQLLQSEEAQDVSNRTSSVSPKALISVGISILVLLAGILIALKVKH